MMTTQVKVREVCPACQGFGYRLADGLASWCDPDHPVELPPTTEACGCSGGYLEKWVGIDDLLAAVEAARSREDAVVQSFLGEIGVVRSMLDGTV